jgi:hypothetical protein
MVDDVEIVYIINGTEYSDLEDEVSIEDIPAETSGE